MQMLVADSNALRHPFLLKYLGASISNKIAISDLAIIEMRKKRAFKTSRESLRIASYFPGQIFLIRPTHEILDCAINDESETDKIFDYPGSVELQHLGSRLQLLPPEQTLKTHLDELEAVADQRHHALVQQVASLESGMADACNLFTDGELTEIRRGVSPSDSTRAKIFDLLKDTIAEFMIENFDPKPTGAVTLGEIKNTFSFRYPLCMLIYYVEWVQTGRQRLTAGRTRANDIVDLQQAAIATFFNGILSGDKRLQRVSESVRPILRGWNSYVGQDWRPT